MKTFKNKRKTEFYKKISIRWNRNKGKSTRSAKIL